MNAAAILSIYYCVLRKAAGRGPKSDPASDIASRVVSRPTRRRGRRAGDVKRNDGTGHDMPL